MFLSLSKTGKAIWLILVCALQSLTYAMAQSAGTDISFPPAPMTVEAVQSEISDFQSSSALSVDQKAAVDAAYNTVINELNLAEQARQDAVRFERDLSEAEVVERQLRRDIENIETQLSEQGTGNLDGSLTILERELTNLEGELRAYRTELNQYDATLDMLLQRPVLLRESLAAARNEEALLAQQVSEIGEASTDARESAARRLVQAQHYRHKVQIIAFESELAGLSTRQELVSLRRDLAALKITRAEARVLLLQNKTGQRRIRVAKDVLNQARSDVALTEKQHPFVRAYAAENYTIANKFSTISQNGGLYPRRLANARNSLEIAREDLRLANQLIELGNLNRESNTNLRRIQSNREPISAIKVEISTTKKDIANQMQARILAEDELRELTLRGINLSGEYKDWQSENPFEDPISASSLTLLSSLNTRRRAYLNQLIDASTINIDDANVLLEVQSDWRTQVTNLKDLLSKTLLWTPSSEIIGQAWPAQIFRGTGKIFNAERMKTVGSSLLTGMWRFAPLLVLGLIIMLAAISSRQRLNASLASIAAKVGSVQKDNYLHTPQAIAICGLLTLPIPLIFGLLGFILLRVETPDPFVAQLGQTGLDLAGFLWFFLTWRLWNRDGALMGPHFKQPKAIRDGFRQELKWFIPLAVILIGAVTTTQNNRDIDVYSGVSVFAFILIALTICAFAVRIFWSKRDLFAKAAEDGNRIWRYRTTIAALFIGLPILSAILAILGYYETARVLLSRLLFSSGLFVSTYVLYGLIRRTVLVAHRRLSLQQAIERRDRIVRERRAQQAAEERGEALPNPPKVNFDEIDVETISRQTTQLLNTLVTVGFAVLMWLFWQDLLPALSAVDNVKIPLGQTIGASGDIINSSVSLWTIIKSIAILTLTVIAGKNLPGFLEVFVLDAFKLEAGTRYAIITVLGYLIFAIGVAIAFTILGVEWAKLQWIVAALGVGIGFGLQEIIANFISGLIILFERPIRIGDYVTIGDQSGSVSRIKIRATTLTDLDNREILIPNKEIITGRVTNWTLSNAVTRLKVYVGIAYGSDTERAREIMLGVLKENTKILDRPMPQALFVGFGDSSLDFELRAFIANFEDRFPVLDTLHTDINKALEAEGISIPFPQRDLHIVADNYSPNLTPKGESASPKKTKEKKAKPSK